MDERAYARYMSDVTYFLSLLEENPDSKYFMPVALAYNKMEKYDEAISVCKKALERFSSYCPAKTLLAEAYIYKGDPQSAKKLLFDVITEDPNNYKAMKLLGMIYHSSDETGEALKYFKSAYIRAPEDDELKRLIEELGASVSPEDLFDEYMKKNKDSLWGGEDKSYKDIERHIRGAEVMMADLVADTAIMEGGEGAAAKSIDTNSISEDELAKLLSSESDISEKNTSNPSGLGTPENDNVSDEELERLLSGNGEVSGKRAQADPPAVENNTVSDSELEKLLSGEGSVGVTSQITADIPVAREREMTGSLEERDNIDDMIENSEDYSELSNILDSQAEAESAGEILGETADAYGISDAADVIAAISGGEENVAEVTEEGIAAAAEAKDVLAALESEDEVLAGKEIESFYDLKESGFGENNENEADVSSGFHPAGETVGTNTLENNSFENFGSDAPGEGLFVLDEASLNASQNRDEHPAFASFQENGKENAPETGEKKSDEVFVFQDAGKSPPEILSGANNIEVTEAAEDRDGDFSFESRAAQRQSENGSPSFAAQGIKTENFYDEPKVFSFHDEDHAGRKEQGNYNAEDKSASSLEFRLEDMISDDDERIRDIPEEDIASLALGDSVPFTQKDILDEIFAASEEAFPSDEEKLSGTPHSDEDEEAREKAKIRLMKLQARLEKLKKG